MMLFQRIEAKIDLLHCFLVNEIGHMQATTDVFLTFKMEYLKTRNESDSAFNTNKIIADIIT